MREVASTRRVWVRALFVLWLVGWAAFSVPFSGLRGYARLRRANLIPFHGTVRAGDSMLNLAAYIPEGILGIELGATPLLTIAVAGGLSAFAETVQLYGRDRFPSTTDLLFNTAGAAAGALVWRRHRGRFSAAPRPPRG